VAVDWFERAADGYPVQKLPPILPRARWQELQGIPKEDHGQHWHGYNGKAETGTKILREIWYEAAIFDSRLILRELGFD